MCWLPDYPHSGCVTGTRGIPPLYGWHCTEFRLFAIGNAEFRLFDCCAIQCSLNRARSLRLRPNNSFKPNPLRKLQDCIRVLGRVGLIQALGDTRREESRTCFVRFLRLKQGESRQLRSLLFAIGRSLALGLRWCDLFAVVFSVAQLHCRRCLAIGTSLSVGFWSSPLADSHLWVAC
jgi:hypothetical protein